MTLCRTVLATVIAVASCSVRAQEPSFVIPGPEQGYSGQVGTVAPPGQAPLAPFDATVGPLTNSTAAASGGPAIRQQGRAFASPVPPERLLESSWYSRVDYFHWNERSGGTDFVNEYGTLITVGYTRRIGPERFRLEAFGGSMHYKGFGQFDDGTLDPLSSTTDYFGMRAEYDLLFEPDWTPQLSYFIGVGTRFWVRDILDGVSQSGYLITGYEEFWWTVYPYIGFEKRRVPGRGTEFYWMGRVGCTPLNFERVSYFQVTLHPKIGITGQFEAGVRGDNYFLSAFFEGTTWGESSIVDDTLQPKSQMTTIGLKAGLSF
jgi:hypothetical protein